MDKGRFFFFFFLNHKMQDEAGKSSNTHLAEICSQWINRLGRKGKAGINVRSWGEHIWIHYENTERKGFNLALNAHHWDASSSAQSGRRSSSDIILVLVLVWVAQSKWDVLKNPWVHVGDANCHHATPYNLLQHLQRHSPGHTHRGWMQVGCMLFGCARPGGEVMKEQKKGDDGSCSTTQSKPCEKKNETKAHVSGMDIQQWITTLEWSCSCGCQRKEQRNNKKAKTCCANNTWSHHVDAAAAMSFA